MQPTFESTEPAISETLTSFPTVSDATPSFFPAEPATLKEAGLSFAEVEGLVLKYLLNCGTDTGRSVAEQIKLPFAVVATILDELKAQLLVIYRDSAPMNDYHSELSEVGLTRARQRNERCTFFGAAPVPLSDYVESVQAQSIANTKPRIGDLNRAFQDLQLP